jgi:hypothetical protein
MPDPFGKTAEQIANFRLGSELKHSAYHFFQAVSWLDLAKRSTNPALIPHAAIELRYGIEYLLFELLVISSEALTKEEYEDCIGSAKDMKRLLGERNRNYEKNAEFAEVIYELVAPSTRIHRWNITSLFKLWDRASHYLHFVGAHSKTHLDQSWLTQSIADLERTIEPIWRSITESHGMGAMPPSGMVSLVKAAWEDFAAGKLSREDLILRLKIAFPTGGPQKLGYKARSTFPLAPWTGERVTRVKFAGTESRVTVAETATMNLLAQTRSPPGIYAVRIGMMT